MSIRDRLDGRRVARWLRECEGVGADARLRGRPTVYAAPGRIRLGSRVLLSSRPVASHLVAGPDGMLEIGDDVCIAHGAAIAAYQSVQIGNGTRIGPFVIIMDTNFHSASGGRALEHDCRPVSIGSNCRIGSRVTITRGASIGDRAEILAGSVVSSSIPADACAGGARARVIGRAGDASSRWDGVFVVLPELLRAHLNLETAPDLTTRLSEIPSLDAREIARFVAAIEERFDVRLDAAMLGTAADLAEVASVIAETKSNMHVPADR
jgi:acetyltransferase-like isoleucine patch superfamily enzyme